MLGLFAQGAHLSGVGPTSTDGDGDDPIRVHSRVQLGEWILRPPRRPSQQVNEVGHLPSVLAWDGMAGTPMSAAMKLSDRPPTATTKHYFLVS